MRPLQTFQRDIEKVLQTTELSKKDLAAAEALRGQKDQPIIATPPPTPPPPIEPAGLVLPKTEVHSPLYATRVSAGELFAQESSATLPKKEPPPLPQPKPQPVVPPVETFQSAVQNYVRDNNVSAVQVMAAEQARRAEEAQPVNLASPKTSTKTILVAAGLVLLACAAGALGYTYYTQRTLPAAQNPVAPFISVDATMPVSISPQDSANTIMQTLTAAKKEVRLSLGLVAQLTPTSGTTTPGARDFFAQATPNMPALLLRDLQNNFLIGVHSFDINQPFILLSVDSYEQGYAGMLAWEKTMHQDLSPFFDYTPVSAQSTQTQTAPQVLQSAFADAIIHNHDARVLTDSGNTVTFLWTFLNRNTILIATNPGTVDEVISRQKTAPLFGITQ